MKNKILYLLLAIIFITYLFFYIFVSLSIPVDGDGALHAGTVKIIAKTGHLIDYHPFTITDGTELLPIFYPKLFYSEMTALYIFIQDLTFNIVAPTLGILIALFIFLITRILFKSSSLAIISTIIVLSSYGLSINSTDMFRMETMIVFLVLGTIYCLLKFTENKNYSWFFCSIILLASSIATKQQAYMYLPIFFLIIFFNMQDGFKNKILLTLGFYGLSFLIAAPVLIEEFFSTGTLFYPGIPLIGGIEKNIANFFNIQLYSVGEGWVKYGIGSDRISHLETLYGNPYNHLLFLNPFYIISSGLNTASFISYFYIPLLILGSIFAIIKKHYFIIIFLILQQILLFIQPIERYFLLNQILASIIIAGSIGIFETSKLRIAVYTKMLLLAFIIVFSAISAVYLLSESTNIPNYSYGSYAPGRLFAEKKAGEWLLKNSPPNSIIITPRTHVFSYYSQRKALWLNQLGGKDIYEAFLHNDIESIRRIMNTYEHSYLIIPLHWTIKGEADGKWMSFIELKTLEKIQKTKKYFGLVYKDENIMIFQNKKSIQ